MKTKIKLKDVTKEEFKQWKSKNCNDIYCVNCIFKSVMCSSSNSWVNYKSLFSDTFLNQELEIEVTDVLDEVEKNYLSNVIKPFRNRVSCIKKVEFHDKYFISIKIYSSFNLSQIECIDLPIFMSDIYKGMEANKEYTLEELGLCLKRK